jgi:NAD(P)H-flavin reductase
MANNLYMPSLFEVAEMRDESADVRSMVLAPREGGVPSWRPGQFCMLGIFGEGECPLAIASSPTRGRLECTLRRAGRVTRALFDAEPGDAVGFRGPYGKGFPLEDWKGRALVFAAGGIGLSALRSSIQYVLDNRADYGDVTIVYGAVDTRSIIYRRDLDEWSSAPRTRVVLTVDPGGETAGWKGEVGLVPGVLERTRPSAGDAVSLVCGPPIMIKFAIASLSNMGFAADAIYTTLENRMKCGVGKCGRCNAGGTYVCKDGPVFTAAELARMPADF